MIDDTARRAHALLKRAIEVDATSRHAFIQDACLGDSTLRDRVLALMAALERSDTFLETPALDSAPPSSVTVPMPLPDRIGGFQVLGVIGSGGMATVYEALQDNPRRRVALKVMRHGLTRTLALRRFEFETEVLARLQHPGIAQIYEAGTHRDSGLALPYFAMEHIADAQSITDHVRERKLDVPARLFLMTAVCDAVHYGHLNGVIHRDLKPGNILVDSTGRPKVIDFGVARSTDPEQAWITQDSGLGQLVGTLNYMSPEQCAGSGSVDVRSDVYSLGIMLYELLCGRLPHDLAKRPLPEALRIVQQDPPPRPSSIKPTLQGDIEAIILKAIDKDPAHRYQSVAALGADIGRYLRHETIEARPPTLAYQCRLFARRHRALVASAAAVAVTLVTATIISGALALWARAESRQREAAEVQAKRERDAALWQAYTASIAGAFSAYESHEFQALRRRLDDAPAHHRGWEWAFVKALGEIDLETVEAHNDMIADLAQSPDGRWLATACLDGSVALWNAHTRAHIADCDGHTKAVFAVAFSADSKRLASVSEDGSLRIWNVASGRIERAIPAARERLMRVDWCDDDIVATASSEGVAALWSATSGQRLAEITDQPGGVIGLCFSPDRQRLLTWNARGILWVRDARTAKVLLPLQFEGEIECAAMSADGWLIAAGGQGGRVTEWCFDGNSHRVIQIPDCDRLVRSLAYAPNGKILAAGLGDRTIITWDIASTSQRSRFHGHDDAVTRVVFSSDGARLLSASLDGTLRVWDTSEGPRHDVTTLLRGHDDRLIAARFDHDGAVIASTSLDRTVRLWDVDLGTPLGVLEGHEDAVYDVAFSPDGHFIASASLDNTVRLWNAWTGAEEQTLTDHSDDVWSVAFSPDGRLLASAGNDAVIRIWDMATRTTVRTLPGHATRVTSVEFSRDGTLLASTSRDHTARLWDTRSWACLHVLEGHRSDVFCSAFSPDGAHLYTGSRDRSARVWDVRSGTCEDVLDGHGQWITGLSFSRDGSRLAGSSWFGDIVLWDVLTRDVVATFHGHDGVIRSVDFSPRDDRLASAGYDRVVRVIEPLTLVERRARRDRTREAAGLADAALDAMLASGQLSPAEAPAAVREGAVIEADLLPEVRKALLRRMLLGTSPE